MKLRKSKRRINKEKQPISYEIGSFDFSFLNMKIVRKSIFRIAVFLLIIILNWNGLSAVGKTFAYFNDIEASPSNTYSTGTLDFSFNNTNFNQTIGLNDKLFFSSVLTNAGTLDWKYIAGVEKVAGNDNFCNSLILNAELNGFEKYDGSLMSFNIPSSPKTTGTWNFEIKLPVDAVGINQGDTCVFDFAFKAWQTNITNYGDGGFSDEEKIRVNLTANMIVLNEFLPNPDPSANGLNFGNDSDQMPGGEWVELYNNSTFNIDLAGYYLTDVDGHQIEVKSCRTNTNETIIPAKGFLVVYRNGGESCNSHNFSLNNNADTVNLFSPSGKLDSYSYDSHDYCQLEPTPGGGNSDTTGSGNCEEIPPNKSYARIPDGIGGWVDPFPTPGKPNELVQNEEVTLNNVFNEPDVSEIDILNGGESSSSEAIISESDTSTETIATEATSTEETVVEATTTVAEETSSTAQEATTTEIVNSAITTETADNATTTIDEATISEETSSTAQEATTTETIIETTTTASAEATTTTEATSAEASEPAIEEQPVIMPDNNTGGEETPSGDNNGSGNGDEDTTNATSSADKATQ